MAMKALGIVVWPGEILVAAGPWNVFDNDGSGCCGDGWM
jgi:hypothetical protein